MGDNRLRTEFPKTPLTLGAGHVLLPDGPGLGIELDHACVLRVGRRPRSEPSRRP